MILIGWKQIGKYYGNVRAETARRKARKFRMPVTWRDGKPEISTTILDEWVQSGPSDDKRCVQGTESKGQ